MRSPSAGDSRSPVSNSPSESRSIQMRPSGFQHHLDDGRIFQKPGDGRPQRRAEHPRAACETFSIVL